MKMSRQDLKGLVKECLVEILSEGLAGTQQTLAESRQSQSSPPAQAPARLTSSETHGTTQQRARANTADKITFLPNKEEMKRANVRPQSDTSQQLARSLTSDPVLADIFADTARTGAHHKMTESANVRPEQMIAAAGDAAAKKMLQSDPTDIFGDAAGKWAALAFAEKIPSRT